MTPSDVVGVIMGYALNDARREALLAQSGDDTWRALEAAAVRCAPAMDAAHLGNVTVTMFSMLSVVFTLPVASPLMRFSTSAAFFACTSP